MRFSALRFPRTSAARSDAVRRQFSTAIPLVIAAIPLDRADFTG